MFFLGCGSIGPACRLEIHNLSVEIIGGGPETWGYSFSASSGASADMLFLWSYLPHTTLTSLG